jgi:protein involved in polysaccharide export with SLBB domain
MKKLIFIIFIYSFQLNPISGQSISDINRMRNQYEEYIEKRDKIFNNEDNNLDGIDGNLPEKEQIDLEDFDKDIDEDVRLEFFGYDFFTAKDSILIWNNLPIPPSYLLGPGDEIIISLWGETQVRESYTISRDGSLYIERVGQLSLTGKTIEQAEKYLVKQFQKVYETLKGTRPSTFMDVSLGQLKSINVTFVGEVNSPGVYPIHPFSTVLTGLIQVGGLDTTGSLRNIQIIRSGEDPHRVDFYKFLLSGKSANSKIKLQDNDVVFIPPRLSRVEIVGAIKRPGIYETDDNDNILDLVNYAAGLRSDADNKILVSFKKFSKDGNNIEKKYIPFNQSNEFSSKNVNRVIAFTLPDYDKSVYIYGQVKKPGLYGFEEGMNMLDIMKISGGLFDKTFYKTIYAPRADIIRRDFKSNYPKVIPINLEELKQGNQTQNVKLHNWDIILIRKNKNFTLPKQVQITGEVNIPGYYTLSKPRETLQSLIERSGGYTNRAFNDGIQLYRDTVKVALDNFNFSLSDGDSIHVPSNPGVVEVIGEVYSPGYVQFRNRRSLKSYIEAAGGYTLDARKKYITIIQPNGDVKVKDSFWSPRVEEGALIIVHKKREELPFDATAFFKDAASLAASLTTIIYIINTQNN